MVRVQKWIIYEIYEGFLSFFITIFLGFAGNISAFDILEGWRAPSEDEYMNEVRKREGKDYLSVQGDFNGDGVADEMKFRRTWMSD